MSADSGKKGFQYAQKNNFIFRTVHWVQKG